MEGLRYGQLTITEKIAMPADDLANLGEKLFGGKLMSLKYYGLPYPGTAQGEY